MVEFYRPVFIALQTALDTGIQNISSRLESSIYTSISDTGFKFIKFPLHFIRNMGQESEIAVQIFKSKCLMMFVVPVSMAV